LKFLSQISAKVLKIKEILLVPIFSCAAKLLKLLMVANKEKFFSLTFSERILMFAGGVDLCLLFA